MILAAALYQTAGLDHILIGAANLDGGIRAFERATGVTPVRGGRHPRAAPRTRSSPSAAAPTSRSSRRRRTRRRMSS